MIMRTEVGKWRVQIILTVAFRFPSRCERKPMLGPGEGQNHPERLADRVRPIFGGRRLCC